jgi:hypothetical protein
MRINSFTEDGHHGLIERIYQRKAIQENFAHKKNMQMYSSAFQVTFPSCVKRPPARAKVPPCSQTCRCIGDIFNWPQGPQQNIALR